MSSGSENNALVEIALALSMAFFSLMVLTMVSMSGGKNLSKSADLQAAVVAIKKSDPSSPTDKKAGGAVSIKPAELAVFYKDQFFDAGLKQRTMQEVRHLNIKYLAVAPDLSLQKAIEVKNRFGGKEVTVTTLNAAWLKTLKEKLK